MQTPYEQAMYKATELITIAKKYRDHKGYRENLGYEDAPKLQAFLSKLDLGYMEETHVLEFFYSQCRGL